MSPPHIENAQVHWRMEMAASCDRITVLSAFIQQLRQVWCAAQVLAHSAKRHRQMSNTHLPPYRERCQARQAKQNTATWTKHGTRVTLINMNIYVDKHHPAICRRLSTVTCTSTSKSKSNTNIRKYTRGSEEVDSRTHEPRGR